MAARAFERALADLTTRVAAAATAFEARWTLAALFRVDPEIHRRMQRQIGLWHTAAKAGEEAEVVAQGEALMRGYRRAVETMEAANEADDAYLIGKDEASGLVLAIGHQVAAADRVATLHPDAVWISPDEIAGILNSLDGFRFILEAKRHFPGAVALPKRPAHSA